MAGAPHFGAHFADENSYGPTAPQGPQNGTCPNFPPAHAALGGGGWSTGAVPPHMHPAPENTSAVGNMGTAQAAPNFQRLTEVR